MLPDLQVSTDVLVETFEEGEHITSYIQSQHNPYNHRLSVLGLGTMLQVGGGLHALTCGAGRRHRRCHCVGNE